MSIAFCITGWHYAPRFYAALESLRQHGLFVVSHRPAAAVPAHVYAQIAPEHLFVEPNLGYDWGSYQQFIAKDIWRAYDYLIFMHDDLEIRSLDFVEATCALLDEGYAVVGNGKNSPKVDWPRTHLSCYAHSGWIPPATSFEHDTVRGSFFAMKRSTLAALQQFEVFWDPHHTSIRFGNHSLLATCGKIQHFHEERCGGRACAFLGDDYLHSPYLVEEERGGGSDPPLTLRERILIEIYHALGWKYVERRMDTRTRQSNVYGKTLHFLLRQIHGVAVNGTNPMYNQKMTGSTP